MSAYFVHSIQAVNDLLTGKIKALPVVVFESSDKAAQFPTLISLHNTKCFGIYQHNTESVPMFFAGDREFLFGNEQKPKVMRDAFLFPELVGEREVEVVRPDGNKEGVNFVNETISVMEFFQYLYKLYQQTLLDAMNIDLSGVVIDVESESQIEENARTAIVQLKTDREHFEKLFANTPRVEEALFLTSIPTYLNA